MKKKKILIINKVQFGYHTDSYMYSKYLKEEFEVTYLCFDSGHEKYIEENVNLTYLLPKGSFLERGTKYIQICLKQISQNSFDYIFIVYFQGASLLRLILPNNSYILDIRTGSVDKSFSKRNVYDSILKFEISFFQRITIISESLASKLKLKKAHILPLGSNKLSDTDKKFNTIKLLYVGTLSNRNIAESIIGLAHFCQANPNIKISYDIFGSGFLEEVRQVNDAITNNQLSGKVTFHGRKNHEDLKKYFDDCNVGVSYIPKTEYFDCQPPTKTYEYVNAGLVCIATSTTENIKLINDKNGVLCTDSPESFAVALDLVYKNRPNYDSEEIRKTLISSSWKNLVNKNLKKYLESL